MKKSYISVPMILGGAALAIYAVVAVFMSRGSYLQSDVLWWGRVVTCLLVGSGVSCWGCSLLAEQRRALSAVSDDVLRPPRNGAQSSCCCADCGCENCVCDSPTINCTEQRDLAALHHISERMRECPEGRKLCKELQAHFFDVHHAEDRDKKGA